MKLLKDSLLIAQKDLKIEFRNKSLLISMVIFTLLIQVLFNIAFDAQLEKMESLSSGLLWLPILLVSMIGFSKYGNAESKNGALVGLLISPVDSSALFLGKLIGNLIYVWIVSLVSVLTFFLFMNQQKPESTILLIIVIFLGSWGFTSIGVFLSTLAKASNISDLLVPIMLFPISVPLIISIIRLTEMALYTTPELGLDMWITLLITYNIVFTVIPLLLFDSILEV